MRNKKCCWGAVIAALLALLGAAAAVMVLLRRHHTACTEELEDGDLVGIVSIGDIVKARLDELEAERDHLVGYVHGRGALQGTPE